MLESENVPRIFPQLVVVVMTVAAASCAADDRPAEARQYELSGQILDVRRDAGEVLIKHGDIENFMPGMTMPFKVRDRGLLDQRQPGDLVRATLVVAGTEAWLSSLEKTGSAPIAEPATVPAAAFVTPLGPGDTVPDVTFTDHLGEPWSLSAWRGSAVAITFMYVRCPLPQFCPMLDRKFAAVQRLVVDDPVLRGRAHLLSVSFDPDADTPARLRAHAEKLDAQPGRWRFVTAPRETVDRFAAHFGVNVIREADGTITHNLRTAVIDPDGKVVRVHEGGEWTPTMLADDLRRALAP